MGTPFLVPRLRCSKQGRAAESDRCAAALRAELQDSRSISSLTIYLARTFASFRNVSGSLPVSLGLSLCLSCQQEAEVTIAHQDRSVSANLRGLRQEAQGYATEAAQYKAEAEDRACYYSHHKSHFRAIPNSSHALIVGAP